MCLLLLLLLAFFRHEKALTVVREENTSRILAEIGLDVQRLSFERRMVYKFHARAVSKNDGKKL